MNTPIYICFFKCTECEDEWKVYREIIQNYSYCYDCDRSVRQFKVKTVYDKKSNYRCYGLYECPRCGNPWSSGYSWILYYQKCLNCNLKVYPHALYDITRGNGSNYKDHDEAKFHKTRCCQKCIEYGGDCRGLSNYDDDYYYNDYYYYY